MASIYVEESRLLAVGQRYQGDIFTAAPFMYPQADGTAQVESHPAILLTPTCDFALKHDNSIRQLHAIEILDPHSDMLMKIEANQIPQHIHPLPPLLPLMANGGAVLMRQSALIHAEQLAGLQRVTTLNERGLRSLLVGHARYYSRLLVDGAAIPIPADDPRLLWTAIDDAANQTKLVFKRDALWSAMEVASAAMAIHYGLIADKKMQGVGLQRLEALAEKEAASSLSARTGEAIRQLVDVRRTLNGMYGAPPRDTSTLAPEMDRLCATLEQIAVALQEPNPPQVNEAKYRAIVQSQAIPS